MATELVAPNNPWPVGWTAWHDFNKKYAKDQAKAAALHTQQKAIAEAAAVKAAKAQAENDLLQAELDKKKLLAEQAAVKAAEELKKTEQIVADGIAKGLIQPLEPEKPKEENFFKKNKKAIIITVVVVVVITIVAIIIKNKQNNG